jgi:hypothetical protein
MAWKCQSCPEGALCRGDRTFSDIQTKKGYWRIPWSEHNITFERCPYYSDCLGAKEETLDNDTYVEGCLAGTTGPLCSLCIEGYNRDVNECVVCANSAVPLRIGILVGVVLFLVVLVRQCKKKFQTKFRKYRSLWRDVVRVVSINITFAQINSSVPSMIEIEWPRDWAKFVKYFSFVNIDVMSLIGMNCLGNFNYYLSFTFMILLPIGILILALINFYGSLGVMARKLEKMTPDQKDAKKKQALHALFELADGDHSGHVDPKELAGILKSLGWKVKLKVATALAQKIGAHADAIGDWILTEEQFVSAIISGKIAAALDAMNVSKSSMFRATSTNQSNTQGTNKLADSDQLVKWTLRSTIVANSLSGATQLLLLAHTPVSRKVFQYFDCNDLDGRKLLRTDYDIDCNSSEYFSFMPLVIVVMVGFTVALPATISFYLWYHRNELYTTKTHQRIGWLYDPFVRGAEFWQVHDVLMKMVLTVR